MSLSETALQAMLSASQGKLYFPITSSALSGVEYSVGGTATIHFQDGSSEDYDFGLSVLAALLAAGSAGAYFNRVIRVLR